MKHSDALLQQLPEPIAIVAHSGETLEGNRAFDELATRCRVRPQLTELFGAAFLRTLQRAWIERHLQMTLTPMVGPEPRPTYRVSFMSTDERTLAVMLRDVTQEVESERRVAHCDQRLAVLRDLGTALTGVMDVESLTEVIYRETSLVIKSRSVYIALHDRDSNQITFPRYMEDGAWKQMTSRPFGNGITEHLLRTGKPLLMTGDVLAESTALGIEPQGRACVCWIGAPMVAEGETIGVIALQDFENPNLFEPHDLELLTIIANQAGIAVKNARSLAAERRAYRELAEAQARLLETERLRGVTETVGAMNHEVNNPLAAIVGNSQLLLKRKELPPDVVTKLESVLEAARRIQRVTNKMASLIQASTMLYPGRETIIDVNSSVGRDDAQGELPGQIPAA